MRQVLLAFGLGFVLVLAFQFAGCEDDDKPTKSTTPFPFDQDTLSLKRTSWKMSSEPLQLESSLAERGQLLWHTPAERVPLSEVVGDEQAVGEVALNTFRLIFRPNILDTTWEWDVHGDDSVPVPHTSTSLEPSWAGITKAMRLIDGDEEFLEFAARANAGVMHIEFGRIDDDINGDGLFFSEDDYPTGYFEPQEDVGWDGLPDELEPYYHPIHNPDPSHDNWFFRGEGDCPLGPDPTVCDGINWEADSIKYEFLNGTEGNRIDLPSFHRPDEERFDAMPGSPGIIYDNAYFSYRVDFADSACPYRLDSTARASSDPIKPDWYVYQVPLPFWDQSVADTIVLDLLDNLLWTPGQIPRMRIWFESREAQTTPDTVEIAYMFFRHWEP